MEKKIAYLILAHTDPLQLQRLINTLNYNCDFFVHIDAHADITPFNRLTLPSNVQVISKREKINWGGFAMVKATINLIRETLKSRNQYSHLVLLSGMDYPIKPPRQIHHYLTSNPLRQFINFTYMEDSPEWYLPMVTRYYFRDVLPFIANKKFKRVVRYLLENFLKNFRRNYIKDFKPCAGSQWWALTYDCAEYILNFTDSNQYFLDFYKNTFVPDEHFFHTIVANSKFLEQTFVERNNRKGPHEFANLHIIHPSLQKTYDLSDFDEIKKSDKFFVRKVTSLVSKDLLEKIDKELLFESKLRLGNLGQNRNSII